MTELSSKYKDLSKYLSYILRHHPEEANLSVDDRGFTELEDVIDAVKKTKHSWASKEDILYLIEKSDKERFEIVNARIRALYGHSIDVDIEEGTEPPEKLYHGTSPDSISSIFEEGLKPMGRQYVHLSKSVEEAREVGKRHHPRPTIIKIDASSAWQDGIRFYDRGEIYLVEYIPPEYMDIIDD